MEDMMAAIRGRHERGNAVGFMKLPIIFTDATLYAGAIAQFYLLTKKVESMEGGEMVKEVRKGLGLGDLRVGYEKDLRQLLGEGWEGKVEEMKTDVTMSYIKQLDSATDCSLCSALFILYGALVIGGGKSTQRKVKKCPALSGCDHMLFDVDDNMMKARKRFRSTFDTLIANNPDSKSTLVSEAKRWMEMNNRVVLSIRFLPYWWPQAIAGVVGIGAIVGYTVWRRRAA